MVPQERGEKSLVDMVMVREDLCRRFCDWADGETMVFLIPGKPFTHLSIKCCSPIQYGKKSYGVDDVW